MTPIDFTPYTSKAQTLHDFAQTVSKEQLYTTVNAWTDETLALLDDARDAHMTFVPDDPNANDTAAASNDDTNLAWTFAHVVCHVTASNEESALTGLALASGAVPENRLRYEVDWQTITTVEQVRQRLEESRRMCVAMLDAWRDQPLLETSMIVFKSQPPMNPIARYLLGLVHANDHRAQLREIMRQAKENKEQRT